MLYTFKGRDDGSGPSAGVILDSAGNLYGTTVNGGKDSAGVVFKLDTSGYETVLHTFPGGQAWSGPEAVLALDPAGNLYGTATYGGVFKIDPAGNYTSLHAFAGGADGFDLEAGVTLDSAGNIYGTTYQGGTGDCDRRLVGCGVVFKLDPAGNETVLYTFTGQADGGSPLGGVVLDAAGNMYGTTEYGGTAYGSHGHGVVFKLDAEGNYTVIHTFSGPPDGSAPAAGVSLDPAGNLYGTTYSGGKLQGGVVFKLTLQ